MDAIKRLNITSLMLLLVCAIPLAAGAQEVTIHPNPDQALDARMDWANREANNRSGYWVGYQITKYMRPNVWMGTIGGKNWQQRKSM